MNRIAFLLLSALLSLLFAACTGGDEASPVQLDDPPADSVTFWPPALRYAKGGDTLALRIHGLKRQYGCAATLELGWNFRRDTTGAEYFRPRSSFLIPANPPCAPEPRGFDTTFKARIFTAAGKRFYLEKPDGSRSDSLLFVADTSLAFVDVFDVVPSAGGTSTHGRYVFRDSTASHPQRLLRADSLAACEILQAAAFERRGDTLSLRVRRIQAAVLLPSVLPACAGPHADSLPVVANRYKFP